MAKGTTRRVNIYINGKEVENSVKGIRAEMAKLINEQNKMTIGSDKYVEHAKKIKELKGYIQEHNNYLKVTSNNWNKLSGQFLRLGAGLGGLTQVFGSVDQAMSSLKKMATDLAAMDDIYADVIKYTGLTKKEVAELNEEFKKMDTRTAREELNRLAGEAGKIGLKTKEELKSFVEAADIIQISLGEDLGEDAVKQIGKLTKMFGESDKHGLRAAMLKVGSAINEVAQNSTAAEPYLLNFTNRLSGIGNQAGLTIDQIIGFGSVLDQNSQAVELSSTAMDKFIVNLVNKTSTVAKAAGVPVKELTDLVGKDMNAAILRVFEALNQKGGLTDLAPLFKDLGAEGARAAKIISTLASKYPDIIREQELARKAYEDGTSVLNEYEIKNNNLQATLDKAKKKFNDVRLELGEKLYPVILKLTQSGTSGLKLISGFIKFLTENKAIVVALRTALGVYVGKLILVSTWKTAAAARTKILTGLLNLQRSVVLAHSLAIGKFSDNADRAAKAQRVLKTAMASTPWGAILAAVTAVGMGIYKLATRTTSAEKAMKEFNKECAEEQAKVKVLFDQLKNLTKGSEEYNRVQKQIINTYPDILQNQIDEHGNLKDLKVAYDLVTQSIEKQLAVKLRDQLLEGTITKHIEKQKQSLTSIRTFLDKRIGPDNAVLAQNLIKDLIDQGADSRKIISELEKTYGIKETEWLETHVSGWKSYTEDRKVFIDNLVSDTKALNKELAETNKQFAPFITDKAANEIERLQNEINKRYNRLDFPGFKPITEEEKSRLTREIFALSNQLNLLVKEQSPSADNKKTNNGYAPEDEKAEKKWETFYKKIEDIRQKYLIKEELDYSKEKQTVKNEFASLIIEAEKFVKKYPVYAKKIDAIVKELRESEESALKSIDEKIEKKDEERREKRLEKLSDIQKELESKVEEIKGVIGDEIYDKYEKELMQSSKHWDKIFKNIDSNIKYYSDKLGEEYDPLRGTGLSPAELEAYKNLLVQKEQAIQTQKDQEIFIIKKAEKEVTESLMTEQERRVAAVKLEYNERISIARTAIETLKKLDAEANASQISTLENQISLFENQLQKEIRNIERDIPDQGLGALFNIDWNDIHKDWKSNLRRLSDGIQELVASATSIMSSLGDVQKNNEDAELNEFKNGQNERLKALQRRYDQGLISQAYYNAEVEKINEETDIKEKELQLEQWRRQQKMSISQGIIGGALAIIQAFAQLGPIAGAIAAVLVGATTAAQIAAIQSEPEPFFMGGFVKKRTVFQAGEKGPEWIASNPLLNDEKTAPVISELEKYQRGLPSAFDNMNVSVPNVKTVSQAASTISRSFTSSSQPVVNNYYTNSTEKKDNTDQRLLEEFILVRKYMSNPKNRQAVISRDLQLEFENQEGFLRNISTMKN